MKRILRMFIIETLALVTASKIAYGLVFENGMETLLLSGLALTIATIVVKPAINMLLLPINLVTFNLFKWVSSAVALYLVTLAVPGFKIVGFSFGGVQSDTVPLPAIDLPGIGAFIAFSFIIAAITGLIYWIIK